MTQYTSLDPVWVKKFWDKLAKQERHCLDVYDGKCAREVFVRRTLARWFKNHYVAAILDKKTGGWTSSGDVTIKRKSYLHIGGFRFSLGHNDAVTMYASDPTESNFFNSISLYPGMKSIQYKLITKEEWDAVWNLFQDDREDKIWNLARHGDQLKDEPFLVAVKASGKDPDDAITRYRREHDIKLFDIDITKLNNNEQVSTK